MIEFVHNTGCKPDLVAIGGIARRSSRDELSLRDLTRDCLAHGNSRVGGTCNTHCAVDISPSRQGIPNSSADTGSRTAEGFDFSGMVVRLIFEQQQPGFGLSVSVDRDLHRTGIDLLALVQFIKLSGFAKKSDRKCCQIHKAYRFCTP